MSLNNLSIVMENQNNELFRFWFRSPADLKFVKFEVARQPDNLLHYRNVLVNLCDHDFEFSSSPHYANLVWDSALPRAPSCVSVNVSEMDSVVDITSSPDFSGDNDVLFRERSVSFDSFTSSTETVKCPVPVHNVYEVPKNVVESGPSAPPSSPVANSDAVLYDSSRVPSLIPSVGPTDIDVFDPKPSTSSTSPNPLAGRNVKHHRFRPSQILKLAEAVFSKRDLIFNRVR